MQSRNKDEIVTINKQNHKLLRIGGPIAPWEQKFFLKEVRILGHAFYSEGNQHFAKLVKDSRKIKSAENKRDILSSLGCFGF